MQNNAMTPTVQATEKRRPGRPRIDGLPNDAPEAADPKLIRFMVPADTYDQFIDLCKRKHLNMSSLMRSKIDEILAGNF